MSLLSVRNLSLRIHRHRVLDNLSFDMAPGQITAITGESGSGKSMTALTAMQLLPEGAVTSGQVLLDGTDLTYLSERALCDLRGRQIGMVFQEPMTALNPVACIGDQVAETLLVHKAATRSEARVRAAEMLARVGLPADRFPLGRFPHELSGGQRQRVGIAMAIALRPALLIADEPTTALDVTTQAQILDLLKGLVADTGMGFLMITHDLAVVADMADQIIVMQSGRIVEAAPTGDLFRQMHHPYTRALFAASGHRVALPALPPDPAPLLEITGATCAYTLPRTRLFAPRAQLRAVDDVSFTLHQGERLGLVGESGCGKSTLTRAILGLEPVQSGHIRLKGVPVQNGAAAAPSMRRHMQVVFQDPFGSFNPRHRVARLIAEPFHLIPNAPHGADRRKAVDAALTAVGLAPADADKYIHEFSGGQRQRIAIARALIIRPDVIIFDEAVSALDVRVRAQILDLVAELSDTHALSYIFISHDLSVVRTITDRVLVMKAGRIVEEGPTHGIFDAPRHPYTRSLIQAAPVLPDISQAALEGALP